MTMSDVEITRVIRLIKRLAILVMILGIVSVAGVILGYIALNQRISTIETSRIDSRFDSCELLRGLVDAATPPSQRPAARAYINRTPLNNCYTYSRNTPQ